MDKQNEDLPVSIVSQDAADYILTKQEGDIITFNLVPQYNIAFWDSKKEVGRLSWDDGVMEFKGDMKESAQRFFDFLKPYVDEYIRRKLNGK